MGKKLHFLTAILMLSLLIQGCAPKLVSTKDDEYGCQEPPIDVFTAAGYNIKVVEAVFRDLTLGTVDVKTDPKVISLASDLAQNTLVIYQVGQIHTVSKSWKKGAHRVLFRAKYGHLSKSLV